MRAGELLDQGNENLRSIVLELQSLSDRIVRIRRRMGNMGEFGESAGKIIKSMAGSAHDMLNSHTNIVAAVKEAQRQWDL